MLRVRVWVLCEDYIWTKNDVQWMSQTKTINNSDNKLKKERKFNV